MSQSWQPSLDFEAAANAAEDGEALVIDVDGFEGPLHLLLALARTQKVDQNGKPLFNVHLFGITETSRDSISVKVPGEPKGLGNFTPVKVSGLVISDWDTGERHGYSFRADAIETSAKATV